MRISKLILALLIAGSLVGCSCRTKRAGGPDNIGSAEDDGPLKDVYFAFDSSAIDNTAMSVLKANAQWLKDNASATVQVEGHCDERGTNEYNMALGNRRSSACGKVLKSLGIDSKRMSSISYGEEMPKAPGHDEASWARNRRCHFSVK